MIIKGIDCKIIITKNTEMKYYDLEKYDQPTIQIVENVVAPRCTDIPSYRPIIIDEEPTTTSTVLGWNEKYCRKIGDLSPYIRDDGSIGLIPFNTYQHYAPCLIIQSKLESCNELLNLLCYDLPAHTVKSIHRLAMSYGFNLSEYIVQGHANEHITLNEYHKFSSKRYKKLCIKYRGSKHYIKTSNKIGSVNFEPGKNYDEISYESRSPA